MSRRHYLGCGTYQGYIDSGMHLDRPSPLKESGSALGLFVMETNLKDDSRKASPATHSTGAHPRGTAIHQLSFSVTSQTVPLNNGRSPPPHIEQMLVLMGTMIFILMGSAVGVAA